VSAAPGWYPSPGGSPELRWWDGNVWMHTGQDALASKSVSVPGGAALFRHRGWSIRTLLLLAVAGVAFYVATRLIGPANAYQTYVCNIGGPCGQVYARGFLRVAGSVSYLVAWIAGIIAAVRWITARRRSHRHVTAATGRVPTP
jgi:hypothetical protein